MQQNPNQADSGEQGGEKHLTRTLTIYKVHNLKWRESLRPSSGWMENNMD